LSVEHGNVVLLPVKDGMFLFIFEDFICTLLRSVLQIMCGIADRMKQTQDRVKWCLLLWR